jgi:TMEM175 potassium channel family protein
MSIMGKNRLEAFSDGVIAIIITIMVLELPVPHERSDLSALVPVLPVFGSYVLSFVYIGIYWNNHHHLLHTVSRVTGAILWSNLHLLFWLSVVPFATAWMGENHFDQWPVVLYGFVMLMAGCAYYILTRAIIRHHGPESTLRAAVGADRKGVISVAIYALAIVLSFANRWVAVALYVAVAVMWLVPDRRIERVIGERV